MFYLLCDNGVRFGVRLVRQIKYFTGKNDIILAIYQKSNL